MQCSEAGRLGRDAETKDKDGRTFITFSLAADEWDYKTKQRVTRWYNCTGFSERLIKLAPYLTKGTPVTVWGEHTIRKYVTQDGSNGMSEEIVLNSVKLQGNKDKTAADAPAASDRSTPGRPASPNPAPSRSAPGNPAPAPNAEFDDEIPF